MRRLLPHEGAGVPLSLAGAGWETAFRVVVSPGSDRTRREIYPVHLRERLPRFRVPLRPPDASLPPEGAAWARELLAARDDA